MSLQTQIAAGFARLAQGIAALQTALKTQPQQLTVSSASSALTVTQTGAGNALVVEDSAGGLTPFLVGPSGRVVVGHTAPVDAIGDNGGAGKYSFAIHGNNQFASGINAVNWASAALGAVVTGGKSRGASVGSHSAVLDGDRLLTLLAEGSDGAEFIRAGCIRFEAEGNAVPGNLSGRITFNVTTSGGVTPIEAMRIRSDRSVVLNTSQMGTGFSGQFFYPPSMPGTPSGSPSLPYTDAVPMVMDTAASKLWAQFGGVWKDISFGVAPGGAPDPLDLTASTPTMPPADTVRVFGRKIAGRMLPAYIGPSGLDSALQPLLARNKIAWANPLGNATTISYMGMTLTATGTATAATVATTTIHTAIKRLEYAVTTATTSAVAGFRYAVAQYHLGSPSTPYGGFTFVCRFGPSRGAAAAGTLRGFVGMSSLTTAPTDAEPTTAVTNAIGVACGAADTNYQIISRTGTGTATKVDTGIPKAFADATEMYELALFTSPTGTAQVGWEFTRLRDGLTASGTITATLPADTTLLGPRGYYSVGGTSSVIGMAMASMYLESDY